MSLRGAVEIMRGKVPLVPVSGNHGEPPEAWAIKAVPPVPWVPLEQTKIEETKRGGKPRPGNFNGEIFDSQTPREPENLVLAPVAPIRRAVVRFKLIENQGGGSLLGDFGDTVADLVDELRRRYGDRLESVKTDTWHEKGSCQVPG